MNLSIRTKNNNLTHNIDKKRTQNVHIDCIYRQNFTNCQYKSTTSYLNGSSKLINILCFPGKCFNQLLTL